MPGREGIALRRQRFRHSQTIVLGATRFIFTCRFTTECKHMMTCFSTVANIRYLSTSLLWTAFLLYISTCTAVAASTVSREERNNITFLRISPSSVKDKHFTLSQISPSEYHNFGNEGKTDYSASYQYAYMMYIYM